ncbi:MAG: altronate dehydrogenase [Gemmataceae bacterium]|nr:altronate dehydrogenase [Gemmataceae bacterium]
MTESILQFGAGNFLRGFVDLFVHQARQQGDPIGHVVVVQSTGDDRARMLNLAEGQYHVAVRGLEGGRVVDRVEECRSISRALVATKDWSEILRLAASPSLQYIVSNTTEAGYSLNEGDGPGDRPPRSFPAKLLEVLRARWHAGGSPLTLLPCELQENNAQLLRSRVVTLSHLWGDPAELTDWIERECVWLNSLVDRIVPGRPAEHPLLDIDPLLIAAEPYALWALETHPRAGKWIQHPAITRTQDVRPYFLRKVRILNGAHTALVCRVGTDQFATVGDAMDDPETSAWLERLLFDEIVPTLADRCEMPEEFAQQTLDRFRNPFLRHRLADIALHHSSKKAIRLETTIADYRARFGKEPPLLAAVLAGDRTAAPTV